MLQELMYLEANVHEKEDVSAVLGCQEPNIAIEQAHQSQLKSDTHVCVGNLSETSVMFTLF
jgi:hypothetical protein